MRVRYFYSGSLRKNNLNTLSLGSEDAFCECFPDFKTSLLHRLQSPFICRERVPDDTFGLGFNLCGGQLFGRLASLPIYGRFLVAWRNEVLKNEGLICKTNGATVYARLVPGRMSSTLTQKARATRQQKRTVMETLHVYMLETSIAP